jgi:hypothetical protein
MPYSYFQSLIPRLGSEVPGLHLFYEQKANLTLEQVVALRDSGVKLIQPGIEALSTSLLKRMDKGVTARQNVALLRYARSAGLGMNWNLLYGFPGDKEDEYAGTLQLIKQMHHLQPPTDLCRLSIDRFSPYHFATQRYGIESITPMPSYASILPETADVSRIAYHFLGNYDSGILRNELLLSELESEVGRWKRTWRDKDVLPPMLSVVAISAEDFMVIDTRRLEGKSSVMFLNAEDAAAALVPSPIEKDNAHQREARARLLAIEYEGWHVPLATVVPSVLAQWNPRMRGYAHPSNPGTLVQLDSVTMNGDSPA